MIRPTVIALFGAAVAACGVATAPAQAMTFNLGSLSSTGGMFEHEGKKFSGFSCNIIFQSGPTSPGSCNDIEVVTIDKGIKFQGDFSVDGNGFIDTLVGYTVESLQGAIVDIGLGFDGEFTGDGEASVVEVVQDMNFTPIANFTVSVDRFFQDTEDPLFEPILQGDSPLQAPVMKAMITKDIFLNAFNGTTAITMISQTFEHEKVQSAPEPATALALLGIGTLAAKALRRCKQKA